MSSLPELSVSSQSDQQIHLALQMTTLRQEYGAGAAAPKLPPVVYAGAAV